MTGAKFYACACMLLALLAHPALVPQTNAGIIHVPGDKSTVAEAVGAALDGDTILLAPGNHKGNVIINSVQKGAYNTSGKSILTHCLFYNNGTDTLNCNLNLSTCLIIWRHARSGSPIRPDGSGNPGK